MGLTLAKWSIGILTVVILGALTVAIAGRLAYPYELEWLEGGSVVQVMRLAAGLPIYGPPTLEFVPFGYPPLFYYAALPFTGLLGEGLLALRLVSVIASLATIILVAWTVRRSNGSWAGVAAGAAFAGAYPLTDGWFDLGRVDALFGALLALGWTLAIRADRPVHWIGVGTALALAILTKQAAIAAFAPFVVYLLWREWRSAVVVLSTVLLVAGGALFLLHLSTSGWSSYYIFELPRLRMRVSADPERLLTFWTVDLLGGPLVPAVIAGVIAGAVRREWMALTLASGFVLSSWLARIEGGAWQNALIPAYLAVAILFGMFLDLRAAWPGARASLAIIQLALLLFDPRPFMPTAQHRADGDAFIEAVRQMQTPILISDHSYYATLAGRSECAHGWAVTDVLWADAEGAGASLDGQIRAALEAGRFATIVLDSGPAWFREIVETRYRRQGSLRSPLPLSGAPRRPDQLFIRP